MLSVTISPKFNPIVGGIYFKSMPLYPLINLFLTVSKNVDFPEDINLIKQKSHQSIRYHTYLHYLSLVSTRYIHQSVRIRSINLRLSDTYWTESS